MKNLALVAILLSVKLFQCMDTFEPVAAVSDLARALSHRQVPASDVPCMTRKDSMLKKFSNAENRLLLIGEVDLLNESHAPELRRRADAALRHLAADPRNEIWIVAVDFVKTVEGTYGRIPGLNLAGLNGLQLSRHNKASVELPDVGPIEALKREARRMLSALNLGQVSVAPTHKYAFSYFIPEETHGQSNIGKIFQMANEWRNVLNSNPEYKGYEYDILYLPASIDCYFKIEKKNSDNKGVLAKALFDKHQQNQFDFALSIGSHPADKEMHQIMTSRNQYAILVNEEGPSDLSLKTFASHRLEGHENVIRLLEELAGIENTDH